MYRADAPSLLVVDLNFTEQLHISMLSTNVISSTLDGLGRFVIQYNLRVMNLLGITELVLV